MQRRVSTRAASDSRFTGPQTSLGQKTGAKGMARQRRGFPTMLVQYHRIAIGGARHRQVACFSIGL